MYIFTFLKRDGYDCAITEIEVPDNSIYSRDGNYWIRGDGILYGINSYFKKFGIYLFTTPVYLSKEALIAAHPMLCPEKGSFVAYKKIGHGCCYCVAKLLVPSDALRTSGYTSGGKIRVSKALVADIYNAEDTTKKYKKGESIYHFSCDRFYYRVGEYVYANHFDDRREMICSYGIHAFMTEDEARNF